MQRGTTSGECGALCKAAVVPNGMVSVETGLRAGLDGIEYGGQVMENEHKMLTIMAAVITVITLINLLILDVPDILRGAMIGLNVAVVILVAVD